MCPPHRPHTKFYRGALQTLIIIQFRQSSTTSTIFIHHSDNEVSKAANKDTTVDRYGLHAADLCRESFFLLGRSEYALKNTLTGLAFAGRLQEYEVVGRHLPTEANPTPDMYRMTIFAPNETVAKSRFWYFLRGLRKVKKATGEIVSIKTVSGSETYVATVTLTILPQIHEKHPQKVKNFGIWLRYDSRSGTHNMYKEYREMSRTDAVESLYSDMAARHRARFRSIHVLRVVELEKSDDVKRPYIKQLLTKDLSFPLPHRISKVSSKKLFSAKRPSTFA
ncbi:60S ribosomal protein L20A [Claviceps arundinis]|uniref:60S ribosomal protein L20A n=1 Tax=Claviceps arundinis TaxID=1623583 RepID=A0A9P7MKR7_9HYPO|nr:60S ribosomal protein L20A [Claviceps arundinis]KAG5958138.1 60S ribosomal protein L20A [Claviceps arundinis]